MDHSGKHSTWQVHEGLVKYYDFSHMCSYRARRRFDKWMLEKKLKIQCEIGQSKMCFGLGIGSSKALYGQFDRSYEMCTVGGGRDVNIIHNLTMLARFDLAFGM